MPQNQTSLTISDLERFALVTINLMLLCSTEAELERVKETFGIRTVAQHERILVAFAALCERAIQAGGPMDAIMQEFIGGTA